MKKRTIAVFVVVLVVVSILTLAQNENTDCGFFCKIGKWWSSFRGEESVVGKAGGETPSDFSYIYRTPEGNYVATVKLSVGGHTYNQIYYSSSFGGRWVKGPTALRTVNENKIFVGRTEYSLSVDEEGKVSYIEKITPSANQPISLTRVNSQGDVYLGSTERTIVNPDSTRTTEVVEVFISRENQQVDASGQSITGLEGTIIRDRVATERPDQLHAAQELAQQIGGGNYPLQQLEDAASQELSKIYPAGKSTIEPVLSTDDKENLRALFSVTLPDGKTALLDAVEVSRAQKEGNLATLLRGTIFFDYADKTKASLGGDTFYYEDGTWIQRKGEGILDYLQPDEEVSGELLNKLEERQSTPLAETLAFQRGEELPEAGELVAGLGEERPSLTPAEGMKLEKAAAEVSITRPDLIVAADGKVYRVNTEEGTIDGNRYTQTYTRVDEQGNTHILYVSSSGVPVAEKKQGADARQQVTDIWVGTQSAALQASGIDGTYSSEKGVFIQRDVGGKQQLVFVSESDRVGSQSPDFCSKNSGRCTVVTSFETARIGVLPPPAEVSPFSVALPPEAVALQEALQQPPIPRPELAFTIDGTEQKIELGSTFTLLDDDTVTDNEKRNFRFTDLGVLEEFVDGAWKRSSKEEVITALTDVDGEVAAAIEINHDGQLSSFALGETPAVEYVPPISIIAPERASRPVSELPDIPGKITTEIELLPPPSTLVSVGDSHFETAGSLTSISNIDQAVVLPHTASGKLYAVVPDNQKEDTYSIYEIDPTTGELSQLTSEERDAWPMVYFGIAQTRARAGAISDGVYYANNPEVFGTESVLYTNIKSLLITPERAEALQTQKDFAEAELAAARAELTAAEKAYDEVKAEEGTIAGLFDSLVLTDDEEKKRDAVLAAQARREEAITKHKEVSDTVDKGLQQFVSLGGILEAKQVESVPIPSFGEQARQKADAFGYTEITPPQGVEKAYQKGNNVMYVYPDGKTQILLREGEAPLVSLHYREGSPTVQFADKLTGSYSDHKEVVDELYRLGFLSREQYDEIDGGLFGAGEEDMSFVRRTVEQNQQLVSQTWDTLNADQKEQFADENEFTIVQEMISTLAPVPVVKSIPPSVIETSPTAPAAPTPAAPEPAAPPAPVEPAPAVPPPAAEPVPPAPKPALLEVPKAGEIISDEKAAAALEILGYDIGDHNVAIEAFQRAQGIAVDGDVGPTTAKRINDALEGRWTVPTRCGSSCTLASITISPDLIGKKDTTPSPLKIGAATYEPFFNDEEKKWDYCKGEGCSTDDARKTHAPLLGGIGTITTVKKAAAPTPAAPAAPTPPPSPPPSSDTTPSTPPQMTVTRTIGDLVDIGEGYKVPKTQLNEIYTNLPPQKCGSTVTNNCYFIDSKTGILGAVKEDDSDLVLKLNSDVKKTPQGILVSGSLYSKDGKYKVNNVDDTFRSIGSVGEGATALPVVAVERDGQAIVSIGAEEQTVEVPEDIYATFKESLGAGGSIRVAADGRKEIVLPKIGAEGNSGAIAVTREGNNYKISVTEPTASADASQTTQDIYSLAGQQITCAGPTCTVEGRAFASEDTTINLEKGTAHLVSKEDGSSVDIKTLSDGRTEFTLCGAKGCNEDREVRTKNKDGSFLREVYEDGVLNEYDGYDKEGNLILDSERESDGSLTITDYVYVDKDGDGEKNFWERRTTAVHTNCGSANPRDCPIDGEETIATKNWEGWNYGELEEHVDAQTAIGVFRKFTTARGVFKGTKGKQVDFSVQLQGLAHVWEGYREWMQNVDAFFASNVLGIEPLSSAICDGLVDIDVEDQQGVATIRTQSDDRQIVAYITAEKTPAGALPCTPTEESKLVCPRNLECRRDGLCYDERGKTKEAWFYYISWAVTPPRDLAMTAWIDENNQPVTFNLKLKGPSGDRWLFKDPETGIADADSVGLNTTTSSKSIYPEVIADYVTKEYTEACIIWGKNRPKTFERGCFDFSGCTTELTEDICYPIDISSYAISQETTDLSSSAAGTGENAPGTASFCGLDGC